jgi:NH(3)-dependent NAD(+) synthetase (EC 6.3.1.5)
MMDLAVVKKALVYFIREEITKLGFRKGVLGLSGGVDSSVVAYLMAEALGPDNCEFLVMPYKTTPKESIEDALLVGEILGVKPKVIDITPFVDSIVEGLEIRDKNRMGNIQARVRMIILYDKSAEIGGLVVGTSNKTEILLGYGTIYGDLAHAINPLGDLYKTEVWELAKFLGVPERIISKKPSADLWPGQTDEGELGLSYKEADGILREMVENFRRPEELYEVFGKEKVDRVWELLKRNQFKRKPPIIAKLSSVSVNYEFIAPRDWGS